MVKKITRAQLLELLRMRRMRLVDVLSHESFDKEHIQGAISLPLDEIRDLALNMFDKDDLIVVYCASFECQASTKAAEEFIRLGFRNVLDYKGGLLEYKEGGLPLEGSLHKGLESEVMHKCINC